MKRRLQILRNATARRINLRPNTNRLNQSNPTRVRHKHTPNNLNNPNPNHDRSHITSLHTSLMTPQTSHQSSPHTRTLKLVKNRNLRHDQSSILHYPTPTNISNNRPPTHKINRRSQSTINRLSRRYRVHLVNPSPINLHQLHDAQVYFNSNTAVRLKRNSRQHASNVERHSPITLRYLKVITRIRSGIHQNMLPHTYP